MVDNNRGIPAKAIDSHYNEDAFLDPLLFSSMLVKFSRWVREKHHSSDHERMEDILHTSLMAPEIDNE
jgi:hypothetical protein